MVFNYLMVSALATVADMVERHGEKVDGGTCKAYNFSTVKLKFMGPPSSFFQLFLSRSNRGHV